MNRIKNIKKSSLLLALAAFIAIPLAVTIAQTLTDTIARDVTPWYGEDQSTYANQNQRMGVIVRRWDVDTQVSATAGAIDTDRELGAALPNGAHITRVVVKVDKAFLPASSTQAGIEIGTTDVIATHASTFETTGVKATVQDGDSAVDVTDATTYILTDVAGAAYTQGVASVFCEYILTNP